MEFNKGEKVKFSKDQGDMLYSGGSRGEPRGFLPPPPPPIILGKNKIAEGRNAGRASKKKTVPNTFSTRSGFITAIPLGDPLYWFAFAILHSTTLMMPKQRSYITLATGDWQQSQSVNFRVGRSTVCAIIKETCAAIWMALKDTYFNTAKIEADF